ncbi:hypothetical protein IU510_04450 [Nocardia cyriacigeorgica]|uniref:hypothetical protein n=1 Tax=Nocardia cyriacigeorgica TaxID=135487 RepID=UPI0002FD00B6|nr:hypothetical protein [Nocardia cyriacigeorgica]MBF6097329.1 hypothetical protein [Nocardia cyriacigeorgica]MBF6160907.1 hypothetical protein [Nocardia cyriacigeorgica]MBF6201102.1 hypothetical protein [Nocardia cyriacigeorgica]MBF6318763.1 hypothetical protein [Nocardia cyriacigeorgica]MBF6513348.1 hypothetical protein [Nocardia cyriacigeorgica]
MSESLSNYADLSRETLATLLPELLLSGHLIDRSGMAHTIGAFGREGMTEVAITEWQLASPVYTRRMQRALGFTGDTVETIFKGLQFDIGAPPQFMDFRYRLHDERHGEFWLDHCGALADVEPLGTDFVIAMCHDIEDPTFDATALATNPHAQVRPVHRPPREPADRTPVCAWTVTIDAAHIPPPVPEGAELVAGSAAAHTRLTAIDPGEEGRGDYAGPLLSDIRFADFSRSALIRLADEVCLQHHLLTLAFAIAVRRRTDEESALDILRKQFAGIAGLTSERLRKALGLGTDVAALIEVLRHHPAVNPLPYTGIRVEAADDAVLLRFPRHSDAVADGAWPALIDPEHTKALDAMVRGVNPRFHVSETTVSDEAWTARITLADEPAREAIEVAIAKVSTGAGFAFADRGIPLPLTVV